MTRRAFLFVFSSAAVSAVMIFAVAGCAAAQPTPDVPATVRAVVEGYVADTPTPVDAEATARAVVMSIPPIPTATPRPPVLAATPAPTITPHPSSTPISTATPVDVQATAIALLAAVPTEPPAPTATPQPVATPVDVLATVSALVDAFTPVPTETPIPAATPAHTATPQPAATVVSVEIPEIPNVESTVQAVLDELPAATPVPPVDDRSDFSAIMGDVQSAVVRLTAGPKGGSGPSRHSTGVIIDARGYILTVKHGISELLIPEGGIFATVNNRDLYTPSIVAMDDLQDIALLKIEPINRLTALDIRTDIRVGEDVAVIGYPALFGVEGWSKQAVLTKGVVSAIRRTDQGEWLQTDAATNPGNSGSPMIDADGNLVGLVVSVGRELNVAGVDYLLEGVTFAHLARTINTFLAEHLGKDYGTTTLAQEDASVQIVEAPGFDIPHTPSDDSIDAVDLDVTLRNGEMVGTFINPYASALGTWTHGFGFRSTRDGSLHVAGITSDGEMFHESRPQGAIGDVNWLGTSYGYKTGAGERNEIRVVADGEEGKLSVNGTAVTFDLSGHLASGGIWLIVNYFDDDGTEGKSTRVEHVGVWEYSQLRGSQ